MISIIEVKDTITDTIGIFPAILNDLNDVETTMASIEEMLAQNLWEGDARDKCIHIQCLLREYCRSITELVLQLQPEVKTLERNMQNFPSDSDALKLISSI